MTLRDALAASPVLFPLGIDPRADAVQLARLARADYDAASFLDTRILATGVKTAWTLWPEFRDAATGLAERCHFIFHVSHVGSTLLSRLVGLHPDLLSLREPGILRSFASDLPEERWGVFLGLWSRTFEPRQTAVIKATSFVGEVAEALLGRVAGSRAVLMTVRPDIFLPALLGGALSDVTGLQAARWERLRRRYGDLPAQEPRSPGEAVAMSWLCEMAALHAAAGRFPDRVLWLDFDAFLADPHRHLTAALAHFRVDPAPAAALVASPIVGRYAKAPDQPFDARHRAALLNDARARHAADIERGLAWLDRAAGEPRIAAVIRS
jgi:hypothetical protein